MPISPLDLSIVLRRTGNNVLLLRELISIFLEETPEHLRALREAIDNDDFPNIHLNAHSIRGSVNYFGDTETEKAAIVIETMGKVRRSEGLEAAWTRLADSLGRLLEAVSAATLPTSTDKR